MTTKKTRKIWVKFYIKGFKVVKEPLHNPKISKIFEFFRAPHSENWSGKNNQIRSTNT